MKNSRIGFMGKILCLGVVLVMALGIFCACDKDEDDIKFDNKYNAVLYESMVDCLNESYLLANSTYGLSGDGYVENDTRPHTRTNIIRNKKEFNAAFKEFPTNVDFNKEMIIVYFFTITNIWYKCELENVIYEDGHLQIDILGKSTVNDMMPRNVAPQQECFVIKIAKLNVSSIDVREIYE